MSTFGVGSIGSIGSAGLGIPQPKDPGRPRAKPNERSPEPHFVNLFALDGSAGDRGLTVQMGDGPAVLSGGDGGWQSEERWADAPVTWWLAPQPYRQVIPLLFDGDSQEARINDLLRMARSPGERRPPPVVMVSGQAIHRADLQWVIESLESTDPVIRRASDGNRIRQGYRVNLLQYEPIEVLGQSAAPTKRRPRVKTWIVRDGDTLPSIAASSAVYGDGRRWHEIAVANGIRDPRSLKVGRVLRIPS